MADDVIAGETNRGDALEALEEAYSPDKARVRFPWKVNLGVVSGDDEFGVHAHASQEHLQLAHVGVLGFVEDDAGPVQGAAPHIGEGGNLNRAVSDEFLEPAGRDHVLQGVVQGLEIRVQLVLEVSGQEAQALAGLHRGAGEDDALENVEDYADRLRGALPESVRVAYLHGKMKAADKNRIMEEFGEGNIDVLVSTTVIEVGINVPNATVMMVENSERFGLAQLHQLRGRVGRGEYQSYCIFISSKTDEKTMERLDILNKSNDGFEIASRDLSLRGPGDIFGIRQSGEFNFAIADIYNDADILKAVSEELEMLFAKPDDVEWLNIRGYFEKTAFNKVDFRTI